MAWSRDGSKGFTSWIRGGSSGAAVNGEGGLAGSNVGTGGSSAGFVTFAFLDLAWPLKKKYILQDSQHQDTIDQPGRKEDFLLPRGSLECRELCL